MAGLKKNQSVKNTMIWQGKSGNCETSINVVLIVVEAFGVVKIWKGTVKARYRNAVNKIPFATLLESLKIFEKSVGYLRSG